MPGMMETVLNVGLCSKTIPGMIKKTNNPRFVYDAYRRLIMMYSDVVMEKAEDLEPAEGKGIRKQSSTRSCDQYKQPEGLQVRHRPDRRRPEDPGRRSSRRRSRNILDREFPDDPMEQLWGGIGAVFKSWNGKRAISLPPHRGHSGRVGHRHQRAEHGLRQHGRHLGHRRGLQPQPGHRREQVLRRMARQRPGRGRGGRHPHAQPA